ncbi:MAG: Abi family protein [Bacteroidaceae bacterium]|nr:Abi family protein [Bacteroidaceae bacterium]
MGKNFSPTKTCRFKYLLYLCSTRLRHASRRPAYQGGTFLFITTMPYTKLPLDTPDIIGTLKERGLRIADETQAVEFLNHVSYFRFATYLRPMEDDTSIHHYRPTASFEKAVMLYEFDAQLRHLLFSAIQQIEVSLRSKVINKFSLSHGAMWFLDSSLAIDKHKFVENLSTLERELQRSKEDFIKEHFAKYNSGGYPPAWKLIELTSFGSLTKLYFNFSDTAVKKKIAREYGVPQHEILESWMKSVNALRNACAHHGRVWNRVMAIKPQLPTKLKNTWITDTTIARNRLYAILCCMIYWLNSIAPNNTLAKDFEILLEAYPDVDTRVMGFPKDWENEPLWRVI